MNARHIIAEVLLWAGVVLNLIAGVGIVAMRNAFDRLHFPAVAVLGYVLVAVGVVVEKSFSLVGDQSILIAAFLLIAAPVLTHAIARAARIAEAGDWRIQDGENIEVEEP